MKPKETNYFPLSNPKEMDTMIWMIKNLELFQGSSVSNKRNKEWWYIEIRKTHKWSEKFSRKIEIIIKNWNSGVEEYNEWNEIATENINSWLDKPK